VFERRSQFFKFLLYYYLNINLNDDNVIKCLNKVSPYCKIFPNRFAALNRKLNFF